MGRNLSNGILTSIFIKKRFKQDERFDFKKEIKNILNNINKFIDISKYDIIKHKNSVELYLKLDFINDNIHDLLKEINILTPFNLYTDYEKIDIDFNDPNFKEKHKLFCTIENNRYILKYNDEIIKEEFYLDNDLCFFLGDDYLNYDFTIGCSIIYFWFDINKCYSEDETPMLEILNTMKTTYYKTELSKSLIYGIIG